MRAWTQDDIDDQMIVDAEDDDEYFDCHMGPDGQCGAAGSEECDWECPVMRRRRGQTK